MTENIELNSDISQVAVVDSNRLEWEASPSPSVWRKRLALHGPAEAGEVTSIVRYEPGATFHEHPHPGGEEIFVLAGVFSDETGDYPAGSYLLNPEGFSHAPFSKEGCTLFVKLRQYAGENRKRVAVDSTKGEWVPGEVENLHRQILYKDEAHGEVTFMTRFGPGVQLPPHGHPGGEEVLVLEGELMDEEGRYPKGTWVRMPDGSGHAPGSETGCLILVKRGHLSLDD